MESEESRRSIRSMAINESLLSLQMSSRESHQLNQSYGQLAQRLNSEGIQVEEQIAALQQMIFFTSSSMDNIQSAYEGGLIEAMSGLLSHAQNPHVKQLCRAIIMIVSVLGGEKEEQVDWTILSASLLTLLFDSDTGVSDAGKTTILKMMKLNKQFVSGLLQIGILEHSAEELIKISSDQMQISTSQEEVPPSQLITMNILEVLDKILNAEQIKFFKSIKLISALEKIKNEGQTREMKRKAKNIQDLLNEDGQAEKTEIDLENANQRIATFEKQIQTFTAKIEQKDQSINTLTEEKAQKDQRIEALTQENTQNQQKATTAEVLIQTLTTQNTQKDQSINTLTTEKNQKQLRIDQLTQDNTQKEQRILTVEGQNQALTAEVRQKDQRINTLTEEKAQRDQTIATLSREKTQENTQKEQRINQLNQEVQQLRQRASASEGQVQILTQDKTQKELRINTLTTENQQLLSRATRAEQQVQTLTTERNSKQQSIDTLTREKQQKDLSITTLTNENNKKDQSITNLQRDKKKAEDQVAEKQKQINTANNEKNSAEKSFNENQKKMNDLLKQMVKEKDKEKLSQIPWIEMCKDLNNIITQWSDNKEKILQRQIEICELMIEMFNQKEDDEGKKCCIKAGIVKALVNIFLKQDSSYIKVQHARAFGVLTYPASDDVGLLIYSQFPFAGLLKLLEHSDANIQSNAVSSIWNIILAGAHSTSSTSLHPHFDILATHGGIEKLYQFSNSYSANDHSKNIAVVCIGYLYRAKMIEIADMRKAVIDRLKKLINYIGNWGKEESRQALRYLDQNLINKLEIAKDGFVIPT
ncbi:MAG: hypothetical protein EZS28_018798 [Streblomastix strix]|uniref:Uncharacterized protein n=1 Tax=Streblomastix strix TaxID=222440 RepID=A0A5J4VTP3_9EUKA|nr:MAG: hypothetical protein EZS28_018798 [Streblomastix strix]